MAKASVTVAVGADAGEFADAMDAAALSYKEFDAVLKAGKATYDATRTNAEKYEAEIAKLDHQLRAGAISQDTYNRAVKNAGDSFGTAANKASAASDTLKGVVGAMGIGVGISEAVGFLKDSIQAAEEAARAHAKLVAVFQATGNASGFTADQIEDFAGTLQRLTGVEDDAIVNASAVLGTFKNLHGTVFTDAMKLGLDLAATMDGDVKGAYLQLGKALNDPINGLSALSRAGVSFTDEQKEQIRALQESGDMLGAQKIILEELAGEFGGAAEAMKTPVQDLKNAVGDLKESVGNLFSEGQIGGGYLEMVADYVRDLGGLLDVSKKFDKGVVAGLDEYSKAIMRLGINWTGLGLLWMPDFLKEAENLEPPVAELPKPDATAPDDVQDTGPSDDQIDQFDKLAAAVEKEIATFGKSAEAVKQYDLASKDLSDTQRELLQAQYDKLASMKAEKALADQLAKLKFDADTAGLSGDEKNAVKQLKDIEAAAIAAGKSGQDLADILAAAEESISGAQRDKEAAEASKKAADKAIKDREKLNDMLAKADKDARQARMNDVDKELDNLRAAGASQAELDAAAPMIKAVEDAKKAKKELALQRTSLCKSFCGMTSQFPSGG